MDIKDFRIKENDSFKIKKSETKIKDFYVDELDYESKLKEIQDKIDSLQAKLYADNRYGMLLIFQASDAAGKDGTIKAVFSGLNPAGLNVKSFKRPSETELEHDFLWRTNLALPERGTITIFNRSYYEEVLVVKVHPEILSKYQRIPADELKNLDKLFENRYDDIVHFEKYLSRNGIKVVKFFLNVSKSVQGQRLIERIEDKTKNWKFEEGDIKERESWHEYQKAFEDMVNNTNSKDAPWYVVPADDKKNMRLIVAKVVLEHLQKLDISYPETDDARYQSLKGMIETIKIQDNE